MKICVDPQGNFTKASEYHLNVALAEPSKFRIFEVTDLAYNQALNEQVAGSTVHYLNGRFVTEYESLNERKAIKLAGINQWTKSKIVGGFVSEASGASVTFDSDEDTQTTMQTMHTATLSPDFATHPVYQGHVPVRGYVEGSTVKTVFHLNAEQVQKFMTDLALHIGTCKQQGWEKQALVASAETVAQVNAIVLE